MNKEAELALFKNIAFNSIIILPFSPQSLVLIIIGLYLTISSDNVTASLSGEASEGVLYLPFTRPNLTHRREESHRRGVNEESLPKITQHKLKSGTGLPGPQLYCFGLGIVLIW